MCIYIFGNGNLSFNDFLKYYVLPAEIYVGCVNCQDNVEFILCDFRGVDTLMMEFLKTRTPHVTIYYSENTPRYLPDKFRTKVGEWKSMGGFDSDRSRDDAAIEACTHFLAHDFNSDSKRKSGTQRNIEKCLELGKTRIEYATRQMRSM